MTEHFALKFCEAYTKLARQIDSVFLRMQGDRSKDPKEQQLSPVYKHFVAEEALSSIILEMDRLGLDVELRNKAKLLFGRLADPQGRNYTAEHLLDSLTELRRATCLELNKHKFAYLRPGNDQYFEQDRLFGDAVYEKFKEARQDIKDAGNCLAGELYTATVFHLMRVSEYGLRSIARLVKVKLIDKGKPQPIEYATWDKVIDGVKNQITKARALSHGPKKNARLQFYSQAADTCTYIRDIWRNDVSHTRKTYNDAEALGVLTRVRDFMQALARPVPK